MGEVFRRKAGIFDYLEEELVWQLFQKGPRRHRVYVHVERLGFKSVNENQGRGTEYRCPCEAVVVVRKSEPGSMLFKTTELIFEESSKHSDRASGSPSAAVAAEMAPEAEQPPC